MQPNRPTEEQVRKLMELCRIKTDRGGMLEIVDTGPLVALCEDWLRMNAGPVWTNEIPTVPGWYWFRHDFNPLCFVWVEIRDGIAFAKHLSTGGEWPIANLHKPSNAFAGPLPGPEEPHAR